MRAPLAVLVTAAAIAVPLWLCVTACDAPEAARPDVVAEPASIIPPAAIRGRANLGALDRAPDTVSHPRMTFRLVDRSEPVAGIRVLVSGDEARCTVTTDADGAFSFVGCLADTYRLSVPSGTHLLPEDEVEGYCRDRPTVLLAVRQAAIATLVLPERAAAGGPHRVTFAADLGWSEVREVRWCIGTRLRLTGLEPGRYRMIADDAEGVSMAHVEVLLAPGDNSDIALLARD